MALAIFDLDHTLLCDDSDYLWGQFMIAKGMVDGRQYQSQNEAFYQQYTEGSLSIDEFLHFTLKPLTEHSIEVLHKLRAEFIADYIEPVVAPGAKELIEKHRTQGDILMIITATNAFITEPIAKLLDIPHLLATEPEIKNQRYTGNYLGTPTFKQGKVENLNTWLSHNQMSLEDSTFYSDSHNDLPLLKLVENPVAVHPDEKLKTHAKSHGWTVMNLCNKANK